MKVLCWLTIFALGIVGSQCHPKLKSIYSWSALDYKYPSDAARDRAIKNGDFIPGAPVPIDMDVHTYGRKTKVFVTTPRFIPGVPVTLGYVTDEVSAQGNPLIAPYPNWEMNRVGNRDAIVSVFRIQCDKCDRMWVLDTGKIGEKQIASPQLHVFSLRTNRRISLYKFPRTQYVDTSLFVTPVVDIRDGCDDVFVYIADVTGYAMIVYDHRRRRSWKIVNKLFYPYPTHGTFTIQGETFDLMDGILGMALSPARSDGDKVLYFHSLASTTESSVLTSVIRNESLFNVSPESELRAFVPFPAERPSQSAAEVMDRNGVLFYGLLSETAIACWCSSRYNEYGGVHNDIVLQDPETLQFPSGMKVVTMDNGVQALWIFTVSFQKFMTGSLNPNETNFRIQAGYVKEIVRGTKCDHNPSSNESTFSTNMSI